MMRHKDPHFSGKSPVDLHGRHVKQTCDELILAANLKMSVMQISNKNVKV